MKRHHLSFDVWEKKALQDPELKAEFDRLQPEFSVIEAMIEARIKKKLTQKELAEKMGTKQSVISRIETGRGNPTLSFLKKIAAATDRNLIITFA